MNTTTLRHYQVAPDYRISILPSRVYMAPTPTPEKTKAVQQAARIWFNKRKFRMRTRLLMDFVNLPKHLATRFELH